MSRAKPIEKDLKWSISAWLRNFRAEYAHQDYQRLYWESYQSWNKGAQAWDYLLGLGGTDTMSAIIWYQHVHKPGCKEWRPSIMLRALVAEVMK